MYNIISWIPNNLFDFFILECTIQFHSVVFLKCLKKNKFHNNFNQYPLVTMTTKVWEVCSSFVFSFIEHTRYQNYVFMCQCSTKIACMFSQSCIEVTLWGGLQWKLITFLQVYFSNVWTSGNIFLLEISRSYNYY